MNSFEKVFDSKAYYETYEMSVTDTVKKLTV